MGVTGFYLVPAKAAQSPITWRGPEPKALVSSDRLILYEQLSIALLRGGLSIVHGSLQPWE